MLKRPDSISTEQKALSINLDENIYGTIVEIGAGQEVARQFFKAGAAAGTIAKTSSAYDMTVSDSIYGKTGRYVSRERVHQMLDREMQLCLERLTDVRPPMSTFFSYAATVSARSYKGGNECHGWIGVRFQLRPREEPCQIVCHVRMLDNTNEQQAEALGVLGVNLIHSAFTLNSNPKWLIESLSDNLGDDRIEVDLIDFTGPGFDHIDNRITNLHLVTSWLARSVLFDCNGNPVVPRDLLYKKPVVMMRGSFNPPTLAQEDMAHSGAEQLAKQEGFDPEHIVRLAEISLSQVLEEDDEINDKEFLTRVDLANAMGYNVLVSDYVRYFKLRSWVRRHTQAAIAILMKASDVNKFLFDADLYDGLEGGALEGLGKLFADNTNIFVYPTKRDGRTYSLNELETPEILSYVAKQLIANGKLIAAEGHNEEYTHISSYRIAEAIQRGDTDWEDNVTDKVKTLIKEQGLLGYSSNNLADS